MPEEPADATVVPTVMPVVAESTVVVLELLPSPPFGIIPLLLLLSFRIECVCPGSVTVEVAVWVWLTTIALAEPPVLPTA